MYIAGDTTIMGFAADVVAVEAQHLAMLMCAGLG